MTFRYPMDLVELAYAQGEWTIGGAAFEILRDVRSGIPLYNDSADSFCLGTEILRRASASSREFTSKNGEQFIFQHSGSNDSTWWTRYQHDGSVGTYGLEMAGISVGGDTLPRGWRLTEIRFENHYKRFDYQRIGGEYLLKRVTAGTGESNADSITFIDYCFAGEYSKVDFRSGMKAERAHFPRIVYCLTGTGETPYPWLVDGTGAPYAYQYKGRHHLIDKLYIIDWTFGLAGEWQVARVTPCNDDVSLSIRRWWDGTDIVREVALTGGTRGLETTFEYHPYKPAFASLWDTCAPVEPISTTGIFSLETELFDMNYDGLPDVVQKSKLPFVNIWHNRFNKNNDGKMVFEYSKVPCPDDRMLNLDAGLFDWNGDGLIDRLVVSHVGGVEMLFVYSGSVGGTFNPTGQICTIPWNEFLNFRYAQSLREYGTFNGILDMNGNNKPDRVRYTSNILQVAFDQSPESKAVEMINYGGGLVQGYVPFDVTDYNERECISDFYDMNGDGLPDRVQKNNGMLAIRYNQGTRFSDISVMYGDPDTMRLINVNVSGGISQRGFDFLDMNGDGLLDRVKYMEGEPFQVWFNLGTGFSNKAFTMTSPDDDLRCIMQKKTNDEYNQVICVYIDMNGDGLPDRVEKNGDGPIRIAYNLISPAQLAAGTLKAVQGFTPSNAASVGGQNGSKGFYTKENIPGGTSVRGTKTENPGIVTTYDLLGRSVHRSSSLKKPSGNTRKQLSLRTIGKTSYASQLLISTTLDRPR